MSQTFSLQRSREELKRQGYLTWITEKPYNVWTKKREDLFGFADLIAIREGVTGALGIQACGEDVHSHICKIIGDGKELQPNPYIKTWLQAENRFFIWAWRKRGERGKRKTWTLREIQFILQNGEVTAVENKVDPT